VTASTTIPAKCVRCDQKLFLLAEGRDVCERCRMGRTVFPETAAVEQQPEPPTSTPCSGCGRITVEGHETLRLTLAEGYCLGCRVQGRHLV